MDEQKHLKNEQGEPGNKTEKSEYLFMQETIKDENSRGKKYRKDLLRIAGLGGSMSYSMRKYQYTERQMYQRWSRLKWKVRIRGGLDILVAHAPAKDLGDAEDLPHQGFRCFRWIMKHYKPAYFFHGHVHMNYRRDQPRVSHYLDTTIINAYERYVIEVPEPAKKRKFWERMNKLLYPKDIYY